MSKIYEAFAGKKAFIAYLMAGDPSFKKTADYMLTLQDAGVDLLEIGIPFSDPIAEEHVTQRANARALSAGATLDGLFDMLDSIKDQMRVPLVFLTYINPLFVYGYHRFFERCKACGISGVIIPDLPYEEQGEVREFAATYGLDIITFISPTNKERIEGIARSAKGFIYVISSMEMTGADGEITPEMSSLIAEIRKATDVPLVMGFGVTSPHLAQKFATIVDGVSVNSAIVRVIEEYGAQAEQVLEQYVKGMKTSIQLLG